MGGVLVGKVHNVVVWFKNGESRVFGATALYRDETGIALKTDYGVVEINESLVAVVQNPMREWPEEWDS